MPRTASNRKQPGCLRFRDVGLVEGPHACLGGPPEETDACRWFCARRGCEGGSRCGVPCADSGILLTLRKRRLRDPSGPSQRGTWDIPRSATIAVLFLRRHVVSTSLSYRKQGSPSQLAAGNTSLITHRSRGTSGRL